jgi:hypothetical protein
MVDIVPNALTCHPIVSQWARHQLFELFTGYTQKNTMTRKRYESPMVLPASWHPQRSPDQLRRNTYFVTEKYDGVRYFLLLLQRHDKPHAFMIDRKGSVFSVAISCQLEYFQNGGSLFEGELLFNSVTGKQEYYVFDIISLFGHHVHKIRDGHLFGERIQWVREIFGGIPYDRYIVNQSPAWKLIVDNGFQTKPEWQNKIISMGNHYSLQFFPKLFYTVYTYDPVFMSRKDIPNDGYIFTPHFCPIGPPSQTQSGRDQPRIWKWKPHPTIDCWLCANDPTIYLLYRGQREALKSVRVGDRKYNCRWYGSGDVVPKAQQWNVVECNVQCQKPSGDGGRDGGGGTGSGGLLLFIPVRIRHDKSFPNSIKTFHRTLPTIINPTPIESVFGLGPRQ